MNNNIIPHLEQLFESAPPDTLRRSIDHLFYNYIIRAEALQNNFSTIAEDVYFLLSFLERADELCREEKEIML
ncbi:hypothetical protein [Ferruginibacter sp. SUN106]|uniref:hypothetical protein n=1 Tax=Ferruginibacter sp. SUN106 TaxID=2978348 RepID=UPI003D35F3B2